MHNHFLSSKIEGMDYLVDVVQKLSLARTMAEVIEVTRHAARELTGADGATFVLRDEDRCHYVDEDAIGPLWKGKKFPIHTCVSGWAMLHKEPAVVEDIFNDPRVPIDAYRPTFVKSLVMVPIREKDPIGAIGNYWAKPRKATTEEINILKALANSTAIAVENIQLIDDLKKAKESLESSLRSRDEFLSVISHELRTPLSIFKLQLQMTARELQKTSMRSEPLDISVKQAQQLSHLVEQLILVSKIQLGRLTLEYSTFNFSNAIRDSAKAMLPALNKVGCTVEFDLDEAIVGEWDREKLDQVVNNLLSNVCKYASGKPVKISTRKDTIESAVLIVEDQGAGIPEATQKLLFDRFSRGVTSEHVSGLGLGLFIAKNLIRLHGGDVRIQSSPHTGTALIVELPLVRMEQREIVS